MERSKEEKEAHHRALLKDDDDVRLFTNGGCGVFAKAIHEAFGYPLHYIPGHDSQRISHVYCRLASEGLNYAIDVIGSTREDERVWKGFGGLCAPEITLAELEARMVAGGEETLFGERWFLEAAAVRAMARIQSYRQYFDGTKKAVIEVGILAYGSLINDPGGELTPLIRRQIDTETPFPVEFGRYSQSRGGGPTVVPSAKGVAVKARVLVLDPSVSAAAARNMLWRREMRIKDTKQRYPEGDFGTVVRVVDCREFCGITHALYTDFPETGKIKTPRPKDLAEAAIKSVRIAKPGMDGISYLINLLSLGVHTALSAEYEAEILRQSESPDLPEALRKCRLNVTE